MCPLSMLSQFQLHVDEVWLRFTQIKPNKPRLASHQASGPMSAYWPRVHSRRRPSVQRSDASAPTR